MARDDEGSTASYHDLLPSTGLQVYRSTGVIISSSSIKLILTSHCLVLVAAFGRALAVLPGAPEAVGWIRPGSTVMPTPVARRRRASWRVR